MNGKANFLEVFRWLTSKHHQDFPFRVTNRRYRRYRISKTLLLHHWLGIISWKHGGGAVSGVRLHIKHREDSSIQGDGPIIAGDPGVSRNPTFWFKKLKTKELSKPTLHGEPCAPLFTPSLLSPLTPYPTTLCGGEESRQGRVFSPIVERPEEKEKEEEEETQCESERSCLTFATLSSMVAPNSKWRRMKIQFYYLRTRTYSPYRLVDWLTDLLNYSHTL